LPNLPACRWLVLEHRGFRLTVTLNRPEARNAMSIAMAEELSAVLAAVAEDRAVGAIVLNGAGPSFCAGGDLKDMTDALAAPRPGEVDRLFAVNRRFGDLLIQLDHQPQAVIAAIHGAARGAGFGLACVADIVLAQRDANFAMPETGFGLPPAQILPFVTTRLGAAMARRLAFTGAPLWAEEAHRLGFVHTLVENPAELANATESACEQIKGRSPTAAAQTKALIAAVGTTPLPQLLDEGARLVADGARHGDGGEGLAAFFAKRPPTWTTRQG